MSGNELATGDGVLRFCELQRARMRKQFERRGTFEVNGFCMEAFVLKTHAVEPPSDPSETERWRRGARLARVTPERITVPADAAERIVADGRPEIAGVVMGKTLRRYCALSSAIGVIVLSEQWGGRTRSLAERRARPARLEDWDDRTESLMCYMQHRAVGVRTWKAEIRRNPTRLDPWTLYDADAESFRWIGGNLVEILDAGDNPA